jgi:hypothetical protein
VVGQIGFNDDKTAFTQVLINSESFNFMNHAHNSSEILRSPRAIYVFSNIKLSFRVGSKTKSDILTVNIFIENCIQYYFDRVFTILRVFLAEKAEIFFIGL